MKKRLTDSAGSRQSTSGTDSDYFVPGSVRGAVEVMADYGEKVKVVAGGTDLLVDYYQRLYEVENWLDLRNIDQLKKIEVTDNSINIGALVTHSELIKDEGIEKQLPVLRQAAADVGSPQIRSRGTIGGNIVTASPAGDLLPPLIVYGAKLKLQSAGGEEIIPAAEFFTGPKQTVLKPEQLLTEIIIPRPDKKTIGSWIKVGKRKALVISSITLALAIRLNEKDRISGMQICLGSVAPTPLNVEGLSEKVKDKRLDQLNYRELGKEVQSQTSPIDDIRGTAEYRRDTARDLTVRALERLKEAGVSSR